MPQLPSLDELISGARVVSVPMRVKFRGVLEREVLLLPGPAGWAEFGPFTEYDDVESSRWCKRGHRGGLGRFPCPAAGEYPGQRDGPCGAGG